MNQKTLLTLLLVFFMVTSHATEYFWVGGSGDWSDLSNWATTSGGTVKHAQVPTSEDDIFFDGNSFTANGQTVTMNNEIMFFRNMDWSGVTFNVNFIGGRDVIMNCFGSLDLGTRVNLNYDGIVIFTGDQSGNIINYNNNISAREMYFAGDGDWTFQSNIQVDSIFQIDRGTVTTNDNSLRCQYFYLLSDTQKSLNLGASMVEIWGHYGDRLFYHEDFDTITAKINTTNLDLDAGTSTVNFTANITEVWTMGNGNVTWNDVNFTHNQGKNFLRPNNGDPIANYNVLRLNGSSRIEGNLNANNLILNRDKVYRFESGINYNIQSIDAIGTCAQGIVITATDAGIETVFSSSGTINLDFVTLRDIHGTGATFNATNSTDLGNNNNWIFTNSNTLDYYWIGGTGNWTDPNHWSLSSGGPSSGCVPAGKDNAHFDGNSFTGVGQTVTINIEDIFIRDMIWDGVTGNPDLTGDQDYSIHITGSLRMDPNMQHTFGGYYYFESSLSGNTIETNGQKFNRELHFNGQDADWTLLDDIYVHWNLSHNSGTLNTSGNHIDVFKYESYGNRRRHLDMSGSYFTLHDVLDMYGNPVWRPEWYVDTENYTSVADNSTIEFFTVYFGWFYHNGPNRIDYNNIIFSSYGGDVNGNNWTNGQTSATTIDTLIFRARGTFYNHQVINYLEFTSGFDYGFGADYNYYVTELNANGTCEDGHISIYSHTVGRQANFSIENDHLFSRLIVQDISNMGSGSLTANISIDNGNNSGWTFDSIGARVLYWVNNEGEWEDTNHWSLTSGGPAGECIPTSIDDVIFDENSFDMEYQGVSSDNNRFLVCHNMTWKNVFGRPNFGYYYNDSLMAGYGTDRIKIFGSLLYDPNMDLSLYWHHLATEEYDSVISNGLDIRGIQMLGYGEIKFIDNLTNWNFDHNNGSIDFSNIIFNTNYYYAGNYNNSTLSSDFTNTIVNVGREYANSATFRLEAFSHNFESSNSTFFLKTTQNYLLSNQGEKFNRVIATNPQGITYIGDRQPNWNKDPSTPTNDFQSIRFSGDGYILGQIETDTLIGSPGKTYTLESNETQKVNEYLQLIGNNCTPIQLRSSIFGTLADLSMPSTGKVVVDFIEMRDNRASGGAEFVAGARSTDIAMSNVGWIFEDPPEYVETGFLGPDRALCENSNLELSAYNYSTNEVYQWSDNSTDTSLVVSNTGTYNVTVTFGNGCVIEDEIIVLEPQDVKVDLQADTIICNGTSITLDGSVGIQGVTYLWDDNISGAIREVSEEGIYKLSAEVDGCFARDSVMIEVQQIPVIDLGADQSYCEGDDFTLLASYPGATYSWQDGSTDSTFNADSPGIYWAETEVNLCSYRDSIEINYVATPFADIGNDTIVCEGETLLLTNPEVAGASISWQDGSTGNSYTVDSEGLYVVNVDDSGCVNSDSVYITYQQIPVIDLGDNQVLCEGTTFTLDGTSIAGATYTWQDGSTIPVYSGSQDGLYWVQSEINNCVYTDSIQIAYVPIPPAEIGNDTTLCVGQTLDLITQEFGNAIYTWQDGSLGNQYTVTTEGPYYVKVDNLGCIRSDSIYVTYQDAPNFELGETIQACEQDIISVSTQVMADAYTWNTGEDTESISVSTSGTYSLLIQVGECYLQDSVDVVFNAYPLIDLGPQDTMICDRDVLALNAGQDGLWQDGTISDIYNISNGGLYKVTLDNNGCQSSDSINVGIIPLPEVELGENIINSCEGEVVVLTVPPLLADYAWDNGSTDDLRNIFDSGTYWLEATENGCSDRDSVDIAFFEIPSIELGRDTTVCDDTGVLLQAVSSSGAITWNDGSSGNTYQVTAPGLISAIIEENGCISQDSVNVTFIVCNYFEAYIPNAFSPNEDGNNDVFLPTFQDGVEIRNYSLNIFDRWGNHVFSTSILDKPWDGRFNTRIAPPGVYVYVIDVEFTDDRTSGKEIISGDITIMR